MKLIPDSFRKFGGLIKDIKKARAQDKKFDKFQKLCTERGIKPSDVMSVMMDEFVSQETKIPTKEEYLNQEAFDQKTMKEKIRDVKVKDVRSSADLRIDDLNVLFEMYTKMDTLMTNHAIKVLDQRIVNSMNSMMTLQKSMYDNFSKMMTGMPNKPAGAPQQIGGDGQPDPVEQLARNVLLEFGMGILKKKPEQLPAPGKVSSTITSTSAESQSQVADGGQPAATKTSQSILPAIERVKNVTAGNGLKEELKM